MTVITLKNVIYHSMMLTIGRFVNAESSKNCSTFNRSAAAVCTNYNNNTLLVLLYLLVLMLDIRHKGHNAPYVRSPVVNEEMIRSGRW